MELVDSGKNILFHLEGMDCVAITPKRPAYRSQQLKIGSIATELAGHVIGLPLWM